MKALDLSFSSASLAWCQARKAEGWALLVQDLWTGVSTPSPARTNLVNARQAGMLTAGYTVVNNLSGITAINKAATAAGPEWEHLSFVSVDVEVATTAAIVRQAIDGLRAQGKLVCIYTGGWFWNSFIQQGGDFSDVPSWLADYDGNSTMDTARLAKLGPVCGKQYRGSHDLGGVTVDANTFDDGFMAVLATPAPAIEEEDMPTQAEFDALKAEVARLVRHVDTGATPETIRTDPHLTLDQIRDNLTITDPAGHIELTQEFVDAIAAMLPSAPTASEHDHPLEGRTGPPG